MGGGRSAFQHSTTSVVECLCTSDIGMVIHRLDHGDFDSTLLISLSTNLPILYFVSLWLAPHHLPQWVARSDGTLYLDLFFLCCDSRPLIPPLLMLAVSVCNCHCGKTIIEQPGKGPSPSCMCSSNTHWVYPYNILQLFLRPYIPGLASSHAA